MNERLKSNALVEIHCKSLSAITFEYAVSNISVSFEKSFNVY